MRPRIRPRPVAALATAALIASGCNRGATPPPPAATTTAPAPLKDEIPHARLAAYLKAHQEGLGFMERYDYPRARDAFRRAHELAPGSIAASINLAIATLNDTGSQEEKARTSGGGVEAGKFQPALDLLDGVLGREPGNLSALYCRGIILEYVGQAEKAHADFLRVVDRDPSDAMGWLHVATSLTNPKTGGPPGKDQSDELIRLLGESLKRHPYNANALYRMAMANSLGGRRDEFKKLFETFMKMDPEKDPRAPGDEGRTTYGQMGKYATVIDPFGLDRPGPAAARPPRYDAPRPIEVALPEGSRWATAEDFSGRLAVLGRARARFGAAVATFDADGDGLQDVYLASAVVGPKGVRDALLLNRGEGRFAEAAGAWGVPEDRASLGVAAGDFDADRQVDLFLSGGGDHRLLRNRDGKGFEDVSALVPPAGPATISPMARWIDLDQDGDLDLYVIQYCAADADSAFTGATPAGSPNAAYRNDGVPPLGDGPADSRAPVGVSKDENARAEGLSLKFTPWTDPAAAALAGGASAHTGVAVLDVDDDRDLDLVLSADGAKPVVVLNDRLGRFHAAEATGLDLPAATSGLLTIDLDKDGMGDLVATSAVGRVAALRNATKRAPDGVARPGFEPYPTDARSWRSARVADVDLDGTLDLLGLPAGEIAPVPAFARGEGARLAITPLPLATGSMARLDGMIDADLVGDALPDLLMVHDGEPPRLARNLGNGHHWLGLEIGGRWDVKPKHMRTNSEGLGVRIVVEGDGLRVPFDFTTPATGPSQSVAPVVLGLGTHEKARLVRLKWPDGVLQCELDEDADRLVPLIENNRKEGSCPVLFTWDGSKMACLGDFLGGGGLGYLVAPGVYGDPDRDEAVPIAGDQLVAVNGAYRMSIAEPMSELAYLDRVTLDVVDRPPGVDSTPDERFAPGGNRPSGQILAWKDAIDVVHATNLIGTNVTASLRRVDRVLADDFRRRKGWIGYAEEHGVVLDFEDRAARLGPEDRVALVLVGYTEYPYSQTNYAASTAGIPLQPPVLERQKEDGTWSILEADPGYPAGMERMTTLELTGKLGGPKCVLRLRTNMEIGWDRAFLAPLVDASRLRITTIEAGHAGLSHRGYLREVSPDGKLPLTYDYDYVDPAPLATLAGRLTRFGEVAALLSGDDDRLCVIGPGDEVRLEFPATGVPPLAEGWSRSYVLRAIGYCKDADPFTATSDAVGPLPWRGMPAFPFGPEGNRPDDASYRAYVQEYQTRSVGR